MPNDSVSYKDSGYFTTLITDYLERKPALGKLYSRFPDYSNFRLQIEEKSANYRGDRQVLADAITAQYHNANASAITLKNIALLRNENTFTVTTGHQLNLFTGPLYFLYKIATTINLSRELKERNPDFDFVPVYWMATEDHDFDEINHFIFKGKKFTWNREASGAVGKLSTDGLDQFFNVFDKELGQSDFADKLRSMFKKSYLAGHSLSDATRILANELFGNYGLVIIDADDTKLKRQFIPFVKEELLDQVSHQEVSRTAEMLKDYDIQVNPREINLFYLDNGVRERIIHRDNYYHINKTNIHFTTDEILKLADESPQKFSPNVIMRPLYQEVILPNLCYIGGGGELAYWLELKSYFDRSAVTYPILLLRNSAMLVTEKQISKADRLGLKWKDLFLEQDMLLNAYVSTMSELELSFTERRKFLQQQFAELREVGSKTDNSFSTAVAAQEAKQLKGLDNLEKKLLRAEKKKYSDELQRIAALQNSLFPNRSLQERNANFAEFYLEIGEKLIDRIVNELDPLSPYFSILKV